MSLSNPRLLYILDLNPSTVSAETASIVSPFQVAIVLVKKKNSARPYMYSDGDTERGAIWYSCYLQPQTGT